MAVSLAYALFRFGVFPATGPACGFFLRILPAGGTAVAPGHRRMAVVRMFPFVPVEFDRRPLPFALQ
jgi:hypothetical protein